jgi:uncharacterized protein YhdP
VPHERHTACSGRDTGSLADSTGPTVNLRDLIHRARKPRIFYPILALALLLVAIRLALPYAVKSYVNRRLHALDGYDGSVDEVGLGLWRGAYKIHGIRIVKTGEKQPTPFFDSKRVDFSVEWHSLFHGKLVSEAHFYQPKLNLVESKDENQAQLGTEENWHDRLEELFPFTFNTIAIHDGTITFRTPGIATQNALTVKEANGAITNITNVEHSAKGNFAKFELSASVLDGGHAKVSGSAEPFREKPTFDLNAALERIQMTEVNPWLEQYLKADAKRGEFALYVEVASKDGRYKGYAKPVLNDLEIGAQKDPEKHPLKSLWKGTLKIASKALKNPPKDQVAAKVPFDGTIQGQHTSILSAIGSVLRNAFVRAFTHSIEGTISLKDVGEPNASE